MHSGWVISRLEVRRTVEPATVEATAAEPAAAEVHARYPSAEAAAGLGDLRNDQRSRKESADEEAGLSHFLVSSPTKPICDDPSGGL
jgi:hypothetical protein